MLKMSAIDRLKRLIAAVVIQRSYRAHLQKYRYMPDYLMNDAFDVGYEW